MLQLTSKQIAELKAYLGTYGLDVKPTRRVAKSDYLSRIRAWTPMTEGGRACKASLLRLSKIPQFSHMQGETNG